MLNAPDKRLFVLIGGLEAVSQLLGFIGASKLPGVCLRCAVACCSPAYTRYLVLFEAERHGEALIVP